MNSRQLKLEGYETAEQMVQSIYDDFSLIAEELKGGMDLAAEVSDAQQETYYF